MLDTPARISPALLRKMGRGLLVTELLGMGVNQVTGDYSRGAAGFWVENGEIAYPVQEITIARQSEGHVPRHRCGGYRLLCAAHVSVDRSCSIT